MPKPKPKRRWYRITPDRLLLGLLAVEGFLLLSERFRWFAFNQHKGWTVLIAVASVGVAALSLSFWFAASLLFRWRFQFRLRSLLVLVVAVAVPCSWLAVEIREARKQRETVEAITTLGGSVTDDYGSRHIPVWLRKLLGDDYFTKVFRVRFDWAKVTDADLERLKGLPQLQGLSLGGTQVTDAGLERLKGFNQLTTLDLAYTHITDAGLEHLKGLAQLQRLWLHGTQVTDAGLVHLKGLTQLRDLYFLNTQVTNESVQRLQQALPNCKVYLYR